MFFLFISCTSGDGLSRTQPMNYIRKTILTAAVLFFCLPGAWVPISFAAGNVVVKCSELLDEDHYGWFRVGDYGFQVRLKEVHSQVTRGLDELKSVVSWFPGLKGEIRLNPRFRLSSTPVTDVLNGITYEPIFKRAWLIIDWPFHLNPLGKESLDGLESLQDEASFRSQAEMMRSRIEQDLIWANVVESSMLQVPLYHELGHGIAYLYFIDYVERVGDLKFNEVYLNKPNRHTKSRQWLEEVFSDLMAVLAIQDITSVAQFADLFYQQLFGLETSAKKLEVQIASDTRSFDPNIGVVDLHQPNKDDVHTYLYELRQLLGQLIKDEKVFDSPERRQALARAYLEEMTAQLIHWKNWDFQQLEAIQPDYLSIEFMNRLTKNYKSRLR